MIDPIRKLIMAADKGDANAVQQLINQGIDVNAYYRQSFFDIGPAICSAKSSIIIRMLLNAGAKVNLTDAAGKTVLHHAVQNGDDTALLHILLDAGAGIDVKDKLRMTPLAAAIIKHRINSIKLLLEAGADPNLTVGPGKGISPLVLLAQNREYDNEIIRLLIKHGADTNARDEKGHSVAQLLKIETDIKKEEGN